MPFGIDKVLGGRVGNSHLSGQRDLSNPHSGVSRGASALPPAQCIFLSSTYVNVRLAAM